MKSDIHPRVNYIMQGAFDSLTSFAELELPAQATTPSTCPQNASFSFQTSAANEVGVPSSDPHFATYFSSSIRRTATRP